MSRSRVLEVLALLLLATMLLRVLHTSERSADLASREEGVLEIVRAASEAQARFRGSSALDRNGNRVGEFGLLPHLLAGDARDDRAAEAPRLAVEGAAWPGDLWELDRSGYLWAIYLPRRDGRGTRVPGDPELDPSLAERYWGLYAWPVRFGITGRRVFFADAWGRIYQTENLGDAPYEGTFAVPEWSAAYRDPSEGMKGRIVETGQHGADGRIWELLEEPESDPARRGDPHSPSESDPRPVPSSRIR